RTLLISPSGRAPAGAADVVGAAGAAQTVGTKAAAKASKPSIARTAFRQILCWMRKPQRLAIQTAAKETKNLDYGSRRKGLHFHQVGPLPKQLCRSPPAARAACFGGHKMHVANAKFNSPSHCFVKR